VIPSWGKKIKSARLFIDQSPVKFLQNDYGITLRIPKDKMNELDTVIELEVQ
jgi:alpha-L-fucosidase